MTRTVYLVDDHAVLRDGLRALLEAAGFVITGEGGDPTVALHDIAQAPPAAVLLDLTLGERSGLELLAEIQRRKLPSRVLVLTMHAQPRQVADAVRLGAMGYMLKGVNGAEVIDGLNSVLAGRHYWSAAIADMVTRASSDALAPAMLQALSLRERQILNFVVRGRSSSSIADTLHLSVKTVETYRSRLMRKIGVHDITGLMRFAFREGLLDADGG